MLPMRLKVIDGRYKAAKNEFKSIVHDSNTTEEFEHRWGYPHMTNEYKKYKELMTYFDEACNIALDSDIMVQFSRSKLFDLLNDLSNFDHNMIQEVMQNGVTLSENSENDHIPNPTPNPVQNEGNDHIPNSTPNPVPNGPSPNFVDPEVHRSHGRPKKIRYKPPIEVLCSSFGGRGV
ncbi:hypothetical protein RND71_015450 [Anisodus tanguticus]|uniref:Uncharacterized protein n=1 Tax=Anisodus tanguticus TaxID=243964 RepID=A0AAE1S6I3_9SOLA|nr:hypothetical protein RND71_015450 [Anisodus tanguticus]